VKIEQRVGGRSPEAGDVRSTQGSTRTPRGALEPMERKSSEPQSRYRANRQFGGLA
jgi:hypothetical protein